VRWQLTVLTLVACGDDAAEANLCELGQDAYSEAVASFVRSSPRCNVDSDCVRVQTDAHCNGFSTSLCGVIVHRELATQWDDEAVCGELDAYPPARYECSIQASCAGGNPVCESGSCTARLPGSLDASSSRDARVDAR
jgi:hypothetical protein